MFEGVTEVGGSRWFMEPAQEVVTVVCVVVDEHECFGRVLEVLERISERDTCCEFVHYL